MATAISLAPWMAGCKHDSKWTKGLGVPQTLGTLCDQKELMIIGKSYCETHPEECHHTSISTIEELLLQEGDGNTFEPKDAASLNHFLENKITSEFASGDLAVVKGWVLSRTEARQAALQYQISNIE